MFVSNFPAPIQSLLSPNVIGLPLATGDEVIKFWKVKVGGEVCTLLSPSSFEMFYHITWIMSIFKCR